MINCDRISPQARVQRDRLTARKEKYICSLKSRFPNFLFIWSPSGFKILFPSAQCRGVRGEYTELNAPVRYIDDKLDI